MTRAWLRGWLVILLLGNAGAAYSQAGAEAAPSIATGYLDAEHWAVRAAWRANEMGLVRGLLPAQRLMPLAMVEATLREAAREGAARAPRVGALATAWYARFAEEFPGVVGAGAEGSPAFRLRSGAVALGGVSHTGRAEPAKGEFLDTGSEPLEDSEGVFGSAEAMVSLGSHLALHLAPSYEPGRAALAVADVTVAAGPWTASLGRQAVGYGWARGGGVILSGAEPFDRLELATRRPIRLPGRLSAIGPVAFHTFFSRLPEERHPRDPIFWGARGVWQPHPRFDLAIQRAAMFGNEGETVTARKIALMLIGRVVSRGFENQVVSAAARFRLPSEPLLPLTAYVEWGAEDAAGAWRDVPGYVLGLETPALPGLPEISLGVEYASFAISCCGNPPWYRHSEFLGLWAGREEPLGHPLGGSGSELLGHARAELLDARLRLGARAFHRTRREENLYVPGRGGGATGFSADAAWRISPRSELHLSGLRESGDGWRESAIRAGGRLFLGN